MIHIHENKSKCTSQQVLQQVASFTSYQIPLEAQLSSWYLVRVWHGSPQRIFAELTSGKLSHKQKKIMGISWWFHGDLVGFLGKNGERGKLGQERLEVGWEVVMFLFNIVNLNVWLFLFDYLAKCFVEVVVIMFGLDEGRFCWGCFGSYGFYVVVQCVFLGFDDLRDIVRGGLGS